MTAIEQAFFDACVRENVTYEARDYAPQSKHGRTHAKMSPTTATPFARRAVTSACTTSSRSLFGLDSRLKRV